MPRIFYTERDIEELARRGAREIDINDDVYLTDLARERIESLGIKARVAGAGHSASATPAPGAPTGAAGGLSAAEKQQVIDKVKAGVIARLGPGVDTAMVDTIVRRVVGQL
ncbi:MAG: hypothetical protein WCF84_24545 [Anaerolineae bacterium]